MDRNKLGCTSISFVVGLCAMSAARAGEMTADELGQFRTLDSRPLHELSNVDLSVHLALRHKLLSGDSKRPSAAEDMGFYALKGLGQPYSLHASRWDNSEGGCVTFVERTIALALASDWDSYYLTRERLRHKGDSFNFFDRSFFTLSEWLPNNTAWILDDVTAELGPVKTFTSVARPKEFMGKLKFRPDETDKMAEQRVRAEAAPVRTETLVSYIPKETLAAVLPALRTGDIALIIRRFEKPKLAPWFDCDHMGIIVRSPDGSVTLVHSAPPRGRQQLLLDFVGRHARIDGLKFLRLREDALSAKSAEVQRLVRAGSAIRSAADVDDNVSVERARRSQKQQGQ